MSKRSTRLLGLLTLVAAGAWIGRAPSASLADPGPPASAGAPLAAGLSEREAAAALERLVSDVSELDGKLGAVVISVADGRVLASHQPAQPLNPASNAKLPTAAAALALLGAQHRFSTGLFGESEEGRVGELVLRGRGDPSLTMSDLRGLVRDLRIAGVREVGSIVVDQSHFDGSHVPPAFEQQPNEWAPFRASTAAVSVDRNTVTLWVRPGTEAKDAATVVSDPPGFVEIEGGVKTGARGSAEKLAADLAPRGDHLVVRMSGSVPLGSRPVPIVRRTDDPRSLAGFALRAALREQDVKVGDGVAVRASKTKALLASHVSPPVGELITRMGKDSDNFTAEMLFLAVAGQRDGGATAQQGADAVRSFLQVRGAAGAGTRIVNGSGLFDANRLSASDLATLLATVGRDPASGPEFVSHLAIAGVDGTLRGRMTSWASRRAIRAKTGTLAQVVSLSGYVLDPRGSPALAFAFLVEGVKGKTGDARKAMDRATMKLADQLWQKTPPP